VAGAFGPPVAGSALDQAAKATRPRSYSAAGITLMAMNVVVVFLLVHKVPASPDAAA
jgi:hypothetical protein